MEMSFVTQEDVFATIEPVIAGLFEQFGEGKTVDAEWPRIPYAEALAKYGTDKPDLRNPIEMADVSEHFRGSGFAIFARILEGDGTEVRAIPAPGGGSRKFCDRMNAWAQAQGLPGMGYIFWRTPEKADEEVRELLEGFPSTEATPESTKTFWTQMKQSYEVLAKETDELFARVKSLFDRGKVEEAKFLLEAHAGLIDAAGPLAKNIGPERTEAIRRQLGLGAGDAAFFLAGRPEDFEAVAGRARTEVGRELGLIDESRFAFAWIVDFPMYERGDDGRIDFSHNPFSMPQGGLKALDGDPLQVLGYQYDLACNGYEIVSGAIRNHRRDVMFRAFEIAGYSAEEVERRFPALPTAFRYGAPPHGGCAAGIDRIVMLLAEEANIREVIMFPMTQAAQDLMMGAPSEPTPEQLRELRLRVLPPE